MRPAAVALVLLACRPDPKVTPIPRCGTQAMRADYCTDGESVRPVSEADARAVKMRFGHRFHARLHPGDGAQ